MNTSGAMNGLYWPCKKVQCVQLYIVKFAKKDQAQDFTLKVPSVIMSLKTSVI